MNNQLEKNITWDDVSSDLNAIKVLDHGFVVLKSVYGTDEDICEAARVSYGKGTKSVSDNRNLIRYLIRHKHTSPLEQAEVKFLIKLPIFVMRQIVRHRTANLNELSGRYSILPDEYYVPENFHEQSKDNKQGSAGVSSNSDEFVRQYRQNVESSFKIYNDMINSGISREQARIILPVSVYTTCYWKCDLHNLMHFLRLRLDSHTQFETREYANAMYSLVRNKFPICFEAFEDYVLNSKTFSDKEFKSIENFQINQEKLNDLSSRERKEFLEKLNS